MNKNKIDIVIPYVNPMDKSWQKEFEFWSEKERGITSSNRYRDMGTFKYVFRSIEKNCKWINKIFLILSSPSQIPSWLNVNHPKLRIVYHEEYIPKNLLPTFNSNTILMHVNRIKDLSNNFLISNDDIFFMSNVDETFFFDNDIPKGQLKVERRGFRPDRGNYFLKELNNNVALIETVTGEKTFLKHFHSVLAESKMFWNFCWAKFAKKLSGSFSRFRTAKNYTDWFFSDLALLTNKTKHVDGMYSDCKFICCTNSPDFSKFNNCKIACFNDDVDDRYYESVKKRFNDYISSHFRDKSSFEK